MLTNEQLHEKLKQITWSVIVYENKTGKGLIGTGFSVRADGLIMTCAHIFNLSGKIIIKVKQSIGETLTAERVFCKPEWDIVILKVRKSDLECPELALDEDILVGDNLVHMGNPDGCVFTCLYGYAAYNCVSNVRLPSETEIVTCENYIPVEPCEADHRILGDFYNSDDSEGFSKSCDAHVPVIQCGGLRGTNGCSGGPVINMKGALVGLFQGSNENNAIVIHVKAVNHVLDAYISGCDQSGPSSIKVAGGRKDQKKKGKGKQTIG